MSDTKQERFYTAIDASEGEVCDNCGKLLRARMDIIGTNKFCKSCADREEPNHES